MGKYAWRVLVSQNCHFPPTITDSRYYGNADTFLPPSATFYLFFSRYCLISYRVGDRHYRIFPDFLNSGFSKAYTTEGKAKVTACS